MASPPTCSSIHKKTCRCRAPSCFRSPAAASVDALRKTLSLTPAYSNKPSPFFFPRGGMYHTPPPCCLRVVSALAITCRRSSRSSAGEQREAALKRVLHGRDEECDERVRILLNLRGHGWKQGLAPEVIADTKRLADEVEKAEAARRKIEWGEEQPARPKGGPSDIIGAVAKAIALANNVPVPAEPSEALAKAPKDPYDSDIFSKTTELLGAKAETDLAIFAKAEEANLDSLLPDSRTIAARAVLVDATLCNGKPADRRVREAARMEALPSRVDIATSADMARCTGTTPTSRSAAFVTIAYIFHAASTPSRMGCTC
jgi:hypothetical protein